MWFMSRIYTRQRVADGKILTDGELLADQKGAEKELICRRRTEMRGYTTSTVLWFEQRMFAGLRMTIGLYVKRTSLCSIAQVRRRVHSRGFDTSQVGSLG